MVRLQTTTQRPKKDKETKPTKQKRKEKTKVKPLPFHQPNLFEESIPPLLLERVNIINFI